jgi:phage/plasmid-associated DNA primase
LCDRVLSATEAYRESQNPLLDFVTDRCELNPTAETPAAKLRQDYESWGKETGLAFPLNPNKFADALRQLGCNSDRDHRGRFWRGIRPKNVTA